MPPPGRDPNMTYFDSDRRPLPGTEFVDNSGQYPIGGPYDPSGQQFPDWVDPNSGYVIEYDRDGNPYYAWYPNGQYQGGNPFIDGDALMKNLMYPRYTADRLPDPNWRQSYPGETPPWINYTPPSSDPTPQEKAKMDAYSASVDARSAAHLRDREAAIAAGAKLIKFNKTVRGGGSKNQNLWYYPPGYQGPRIKALGSNVEEKSTSDLSILGPPGDSWGFIDARGNPVNDNQPASNIPPGPEPEVVPPSNAAGAPPPSNAGAASSPQMSWQETEAQRRSEWEAGGNKATDYFDRYGNYNPDGYSSGPQMTQAESAYWAQQRKVDPRVYQSQMYDPGDWAGQDTQRRMQTTRGPGGAARMSWNTQDPQYAALSAEQKAVGEAKMAAFNQQFDANNQVNPANEKLYKVQQMSPQLRQTLMANQAQSTPAQKAAWAQWGDALTQYNRMQGTGNQPPSPGGQPPPGGLFNPFAGPTPGGNVNTNAAAPASGQPQNRQFGNNNPFMNAKGELRNRAVKKLGRMFAETRGNVNPFA